MSPLVIFGLIMQVFAVGIVLIPQRRWLGSVGALFVVMLFVFHGLTEVVSAMLPEAHRYAQLVDRQEKDRWVVLVSGAILVFAVAYALTASFTTRRAPDAQPAVPRLDWRILLLLTAPGYVVAVSGLGEGELGYWVSGLTQAFIVFGIMLLSLAYLLTHQGRHVLGVLAVQSVAIALLGQRLEVLIGLVAVVLILIRYRYLVRFRSLISAVVVFGLLAVVMSSARASVGRQTLRGTAAERALGLTVGVRSLDEQAGDLAWDFVYRFDGNIFPTLLYAAFAAGWSPAGFEPLWNNALLIVPRFLDPAKLDRDIIDRNEKIYLQYHYALPLDIDFLPSTFGMLYGYYGAISLYGGAALFGMVLAVADRWLRRRMTLLTLLVGMGLATCAVHMDHGMGVYFLTLRALATLYVVLVGLRLAGQLAGAVLRMGQERLVVSSRSG